MLLLGSRSVVGLLVSILDIHRSCTAVVLPDCWLEGGREKYDDTPVESFSACCDVTCCDVTCCDVTCCDVTCCDEVDVLSVKQLPTWGSGNERAVSSIGAVQRILGFQAAARSLPR